MRQDSQNAGAKQMNTRSRIVGVHFRYPDETGKRVAEGGQRLSGKIRTSRADVPLVTIITVCWNSAKTIERTFQSVKAQTYSNIEYVVVDGGSTDGTVELLKAHDALLDYYVSEPDTGLYHAMNKGLELAQGDYILFLNSDDWYEPHAVAALVSAQSYSGGGFSGALARYVNADGSSHVLRTMPFDHGTLLRMPLRHETMLVPATLYDKIGPYNTTYPIIADFDYAIRLFKSGAPYCEVRRPLLNFTTGGVSNTQRDRLFSETRSLLAQVFPFLTDDDLLILTTPETLDHRALTALANRHAEHVDLVRAVRAVLSDRRVHGGKPWKDGDLLAVTPQMLPRISVIIPVYKARDSLDATLDNVLGQGFEALEIICVDDCGGDGSDERILERAQQDSRIRLIRNDRNRGPGAARNAGIRAARGAYVFFLDADDSIPPGSLQALFDAAVRTRAPMVRGAFQALQKVHGESGGGMIKHPLGQASVLDGTTLAQSPRLLQTTEGHWAALYETAFAETILYAEDIRVGEDSMFMVKAHALAPAITIIPDVVYTYQANPGSMMNQRTASKYFDGLTWRRRAYHVLRDAGVPEIGKTLLLNFWSMPYFRALAATLDEHSQNRFFARLCEMFAETGDVDFGTINDLELRNFLSAKYPSLSPAVRKGTVGQDKLPADALRIATFTTQDHGGAGLGSQRRVEALRRHGVNAQIYCAFKKTSHDYVHKLPYARPLAANADRDTAWQAWLEASVLRRVEHPGLKARELFSKPGTIVDFRDIATVFSKSDVIHMHWVSGIFDLDHTEVLADKPVVWTLADMNAFTGGCHYSEGCEGYKTDCKKCPLLEPGSDLAHTAWQKKRAAYAKIKNLQIICPSKWLADCAKASSLFGNRPVHVIPNAFPVDRFTPTNKLVARQKLGLPMDKKLVAFGADSLNNRRKGGDVLAASIRHLRDKGMTENVEGLFFGAASLDLGIKGHNMGHVSDEQKLSLIYAAADVFAFPSREDNAPLTVAESLLSGTPVVAFPVGNVPEMIRHKVTGYIAKYEDAKEFADGLAWALADCTSHAALMRGLRGCCDARRHNDPQTVVQRHVALYRAMLDGAVEPLPSLHQP